MSASTIALLHNACPNPMSDVYPAGNILTEYRRSHVPLVLDITCAACGVVALPGKKHKRCTGCKLAMYCNDSCQRTHWETYIHGHKATCMEVYDRVDALGGRGPRVEALLMQSKEQAERAVATAIYQRLHSVEVIAKEKTIISQGPPPVVPIPRGALAWLPKSFIYPAGKDRTNYRRKQAPLTLKFKCAACGAAAPLGKKLKRCLGCKLARYCNKSCQRTHWKADSYEHKATCVKVYDRADALEGDGPRVKAVLMEAKERAERAVVGAISKRLASLDKVSTSRKRRQRPRAKDNPRERENVRE